jgi:hypothetical protein
VSRGPGRIERAIRALFDAHSDEAFTTDELCEHCYPDARPIERKHQVAVLRAARNVAGPDPDWAWYRADNQGRRAVFFNRANVQSWHLADRISDGYTIYRSPKRLRQWDKVDRRGGNSLCLVLEDRDAALWAMSQENGSRRAQLTECVARHIAYRDGDAETRERIAAEDTANRAAQMAAALAAAR